MEAQNIHDDPEFFAGYMTLDRQVHGSTAPASPTGVLGRTRQPSTQRILSRMTTPVPTRFTDDELAIIDQLVDDGLAASRSAVIRRGVHHLADAVRRAKIGESIAASYRAVPQTSEDDELAMANAMAMTEAEPW